MIVGHDSQATLKHRSHGLFYDGPLLTIDYITAPTIRGTKMGP